MTELETELHRQQIVTLWGLLGQRDAWILNLEAQVERLESRPPCFLSDEWIQQKLGALLPRWFGVGK
jgi:hypothetical protein